MHDCSISSFLNVKSMNALVKEMKYCIMFVQNCFSIYIFCVMSSTAKKCYERIKIDKTEALINSQCMLASTLCND